MLHAWWGGGEGGWANQIKQTNNRTEVTAGAYTLHKQEVSYRQGVRSCTLFWMKVNFCLNMWLLTTERVACTIREHWLCYRHRTDLALTLSVQVAKFSSNSAERRHWVNQVQIFPLGLWNQKITSDKTMHLILTLKLPNEIYCMFVRVSKENTTTKAHVTETTTKTKTELYKNSHCDYKETLRSEDVNASLSLGPASWRPTTIKWRQSSQSNRHSTIDTRQTEYYEALPSSANAQSHLTSSFADDGNASWYSVHLASSSTDDGNASWYSVCRVPIVEWRLDCENCRHLTVVGLQDTGPRSTNPRSEIRLQVVCGHRSHLRSTRLVHFTHLSTVFAATSATTTTTTAATTAAATVDCTAGHWEVLISLSPHPPISTEFFTTVAYERRRQNLAAFLDMRVPSYALDLIKCTLR